MASQSQPVQHRRSTRGTRSAAVAANIRAEAARTRTPQKAIAAALGISQQSVSQRLNGVVAIDVEELGVIAELLGVPDEVLLADPSRSAS